jgi:spore coat polysaccharide biosynthesis protein SpsF
MKIVVIIQARMGSTRLPGKVLRKIEDKTVLGHIVDFLKNAKNIDKIIIATTNLPEDNEIEKTSKNHKVDCFRGDSKNVLKRYYECAKMYKADIVIRLTGDNPMIDSTLIDSIIKECKKEKYDYISNVIDKSYPIGYSTCEGFNFNLLSNLFKNQQDSDSLEHVTYHIRKNPSMYKIKSIKAPKDIERSKWRLSIDYEQDITLMKKIFSNIYVPGKSFEYRQVVDFLDKNPELLKINDKCK